MTISIKSLAGKNVTVLGDIMLDRYIWGEVTRISPEAPVPIVLAKKDSSAPGGAANTASNIASLGGNSSLIGVIGNDEAGSRIRSHLAENRIADMLATEPNRPTTQKTRVMGNRQQLARLDKESRETISAKTEDEVIKRIKEATKKCEAFVVSDYAKGLLTARIASAIHEECKQRKIPVICDGKPQNKEFFKSSYLITPNKKEAFVMAEADEHESIESMGQKLSHELNCNVLITLSEQGMILFGKKGGVTRIPTKAREVFDVSGAGDTVVAATALSLAAGMPLIDACRIGNYAAGISVGKLGTSTVTYAELEEAIKNDGQ